MFPRQCMIEPITYSSSCVATVHVAGSLSTSFFFVLLSGIAPLHSQLNQLNPLLNCFKYSIFKTADVLFFLVYIFLDFEIQSSVNYTLVICNIIEIIIRFQQSHISPNYIKPFEILQLPYFNQNIADSYKRLSERKIRYAAVYPTSGGCRLPSQGDQDRIRIYLYMYLRIFF